MPLPSTARPRLCVTDFDCLVSIACYLLTSVSPFISSYGTPTTDSLRYLRPTHTPLSNFITVRIIRGRQRSLIRYTRSIRHTLDGRSISYPGSDAFSAPVGFVILFLKVSCTKQPKAAPHTIGILSSTCIINNNQLPPPSHPLILRAHPFPKLSPR